jgi:hypothetical protein
MGRMRADRRCAARCVVRGRVGRGWAVPLRGEHAGGDAAYGEAKRENSACHSGANGPCQALLVRTVRGPSDLHEGMQKPLTSLHREDPLVSDASSLTLTSGRLSV